MPFPELKLHTPVFSVAVSSTRKGGFHVALRSLLVLVLPYQHGVGSSELYAMFRQPHEPNQAMNLPEEHALSELHQPMAQGSLDFKSRLFASREAAKAYFDEVQAVNERLVKDEILSFHQGKRITVQDIDIGDVVYVVEVSQREGMKAKIFANKITSQAYAAGFTSDLPHKHNTYRYCDSEDRGYASTLDYHQVNIDQDEMRGLDQCFFTLGAAKFYQQRINEKVLTSEEVSVYQAMNTIVIGAGRIGVVGVGLGLGSLNTVTFNPLMIDAGARSISLLNDNQRNWPPTDRWGRIAPKKRHYS
jgi:hypothetical protein